MQPAIDNKGDPNILASLFGIPVAQVYELYPHTLIWDPPILSENDIEIQGMNIDMNTTNNDMTVNNNEGYNSGTEKPETEQKGTTLKPIRFSFNGKRYYIKENIQVRILNRKDGQTVVFFPHSSVQAEVNGGRRHKKRRTMNLRHKKNKSRKSRKYRRAH